MTGDLAFLLTGEKPAGSPAASTSSAPDDYSAALRTLYAENPQADDGELTAMASVIANRAREKGISVGAVVQENDGKTWQFEPWSPADASGRKRLDALKPGTPEWDRLDKVAGPILRGEAEPPHAYTNFYAPDAQAKLGRGKPDWDDGTGERVGAHLFFAKGGKGGPDLASVLGVASEPVSEDAAEAEFAKTFGDPGRFAEAGLTGAGVIPVKGNPNVTLNEAQTKAHGAAVKGGAYDPEAPDGDPRNPMFIIPGVSEKDVPPGAYYRDEKGELKRGAGVEDKGAVHTALGRGVGDVMLSMGQLTGALNDSPDQGFLGQALHRMDFDQQVYDANFKGDLLMGTGRFAGQLAGSIPLLAGGEAVAGKALAGSPVGQFVMGKAGQAMAPGLARFGTRAGSLAAYGAGAGASGAALVSSASDAPLGEQMALGGLGGALVGPLMPAAAAAGRGVGRFVNGVLEPLTVSGRDKIAERVITKAAGGEVGQPDLTSYVPGVEPTLGEASGNAGLARMENVLRTNPQLVEQFTARETANKEARALFLENARGDSGTVADLVSAREPIVADARKAAFAQKAPTDPTPVVSVIDEALASPEAQMDEVVRPLTAIRDKIVKPPADTTPEEVAAFNRGVAQTFGVDAPALTPEVMSEARSKLGAEFQRIAGATNLRADEEFTNGLQSVINDAGQVIEEGKVKPLQNLVTQILSTVKGGAMTGASYQALIRKGGPLDVLGQSSDGAMRHYAGQLREVLDDALERTMASDFPGDRIPRPKGAFVPEDNTPRADLTDQALNLIRDRKKGGGGRGPALSDALIKAGGVADDGGELGAMDLQASYGKRGGLLGRKGGMTLEDAATLAADRGYIPKQLDADGKFDATKHVQPLLDALRRELDGDRVFANAPTVADDVKAHADELEEMLSELGIDVEKVPNGRIKRDMAEYFGTSPVDDAISTVPPSSPARPEVTRPEQGFTPEEAPAAAAQAVEDMTPDEADALLTQLSGSKVVDEAGDPLVVYHGAKRGDRIHEAGGFKAERATSGPMAFFSDDPNIASNYAAGKQDTSFEPDDWRDLFVVGNTPMPKAWDASDMMSVRVAVRQKGHLVYQTDDGKFHLAKSEADIPPDASHIGRDTFEDMLRDNKRNGFNALYDAWVNSGTLVGDEDSFRNVLKLFGVKSKFDDPHGEFPAVFPSYLNIKNPLDVRAMPDDAVAAIREAAKTAPAREFQSGADSWDKRATSPEEWMQRFEDDLAGDNATGGFSFTVIPDWVTEALKKLGYDGVVDRGGKMGGEGHNVYVPFSEDQVIPAVGPRPKAPAASAAPEAAPFKAAGATDLPEGKAAALKDFGAFGDYAFDGKALTKGGQKVADLKLRVDGNRLVVDDIEATPKGKGEGTAALKAIIEAAHAKGMAVALTTDAMRGKANQAFLREYYPGLGFVKTKGDPNAKGISEEFYIPPPASAAATPAPGGAAPAAGVDEAANAARGQAAVDELRAVRLQYKNLKTVEAALRSAGPDKQVTPEAVLSAVKRNFGQFAYKGGGPLGDVTEAALKAKASRPAVTVDDPAQLYGMRENLSSAIDKLEAKGTDSANLAAAKLREVRDALDGTIETGAPAYRSFLEVAERSREPVEAMRYLQSLKLTDAKGAPTLSRVVSALERIEAARGKPGANAAKMISEATIKQLEALRDDLLRASNIDLGKARGSDTYQNLATDNFSGGMGVPLALGAAVTNPLAGAAMGAGKMFYGMKNKEILDQLAARFLDPSQVPTPVPQKRRILNLPAGQSALPGVTGMLVGRLAGQ